MSVAARPQIPAVVQQYVEDAAVQRNTRSVLVRAPHVRLPLLRRLDDRIAASLDGLAVAGDLGRRLCIEALAAPSRGAIFSAAVIAIEDRTLPLLQKLLALAEAVPEARTGLVSALGWVPAASLRGVIKALLDSAHSFHRSIALAACGMHHVDPGPVLDAAIGNPEERWSAMAVVARLGRVDLLHACLAGLANEEDPQRQFVAARSGLLLGDRRTAVQVLGRLALENGSCQPAASQLVLKLLDAEQAHALLQSMAQESAPVRTLIRAIGAAGDPRYVPWLIERMEQPELARLACEAFSTITGVDLAALDLERRPPEDLLLGPSDIPDDECVDMDEDDSLPWPDTAKVSAWWEEAGHRFVPGARYFVGQPPSIAHCASVLRTGFQRQRISAADHLCVLQPGTKLFPTSAPAWRQQHWLDAMDA